MRFSQGFKIEEFPQYYKILIQSPLEGEIRNLYQIPQIIFN